MATAATEQPLNGTKTTISSLLDTLTSCLSSAGSSLPLAAKNAPSDVTIEPPTDGISLLDTKSDLLLSYLHNLVFLILFQLRGISDAASSKTSSNGVVVHEGEKENSSSLPEDVVKKLVELRVYLDRGVRPLESRLKYQIDKVVKAAEDAERSQRAAPSAKSKSKKTKKKTKAQTSVQSEDDVSDSAGEESPDDEEVNGEEEEEEEEDDDEEEIDEMAYRPNVSAFARGLQAKAERQKSSTTKDKKSTPSDGIYRPPRIKPTALPTTESNRKDREARRLKKSSVIDEFVAAEMSSAPVAEPSIGTTIQRGGRKVISQQEREREMERRNYEETNFVRLPKESRKERAKRGAREGGREGFGGEEFRLLREGADRIGRLTRRAEGSSRGGALEKSRKRRLTEDGPRGDGVGIGQVFEKRQKKIDNWKK
jgi:U3 small nucleolar ribonucleoprotein protein LCP5